MEIEGPSFKQEEGSWDCQQEGEEEEEVPRHARWNIKERNFQEDVQGDVRLPWIVPTHGSDGPQETSKLQVSGAAPLKAFERRGANDYK